MSSHPFKVKAVFEYTSPHDDDLNFPEGQIITVTEDDEDDWYTGEYVDASGVKNEGIFPRNFVEKYEPTAPPRPTRAPRPKKDAESLSSPLASEATAPAPSKLDTSIEPQADAQERTNNVQLPSKTIPSPDTTPPPTGRTVENPPAVTQAPPKPAPSAAKQSGPPQVSEKPGGGSFRDRIAAFNKGAAPPPAPFKPGGLGSGSSSFIKKPFVAPPPSKDAYIPPPREPAAPKIYRRDEDPEIAAKEAENLENAERAGLASTVNEDEAEDQPKPTSLKERIALLQKQQMEQAARHAEAAQKKEKPKRPPKKRTESHNVADGQDSEDLPLEKLDSNATIGKNSIDLDEDESSASRAMPKRKASRGPPAVPSTHRESFADGNEADMSGAGDETEDPEDFSTGRDDSDEKPRTRAPAPRMPTTSRHETGTEGGGEREAANEEGAEEGEEEGDEEDDDVDPEVRRKEELRARMAKMSGGMGMYGMFGGGMSMPGAALSAKKKPGGGNEKRQHNDDNREDSSSSYYGHAPPVPGVPMPGMARVKSPEENNRQGDLEEDGNSQFGTVTDVRSTQYAPDVEDTKPTVPAPQKSERPPGPARDGSSAPPVPGGRPAPPPVPSESRPPPPPPPSVPKSPNAGSESDDEMSLHALKQPQDPPAVEAAPRAVPPRPLGPPVPSRPGESPTSPRSPPSKRASYSANDGAPATSPTTPGGATKRASRVPPIPLSTPPISSPQNRAPPPPPPGSSLSRSSTGDGRVLTSAKHTEQDKSNSDDDDEEEEVTEYEGDYDTDIASAASHKDALKSNATDSSLDDATPVRSTVAPPSGVPPPLPQYTSHRALPPPPPSQLPPSGRTSADMPRAAPPPPPPTKQQQQQTFDDDIDEYDPYRYTAPVQGRSGATMVKPSVEKDEDDVYSASPPRSQPPRPQERAAPLPPPRDAAPPPAARPPPRQSTDIQRLQTGSRKSTDMSRISMDSGYVANDVDLGQSSLWWTRPSNTPPVFQTRKDILHETEESTTTKRGGKSSTTRDLYLLFQDYSQTVITVRYDPNNPSDASLEQRHEPPPSRLRQDQLEASHERFGRAISEAVSSKKDTVVGDGTPHSLVTELLRPFPDALHPVGTRSYGALVYSNMANASTTQNDEIRPGDVITFRNAKFQGKHGPMHAKYSMEVGGSGVGHVGIVAEWDGTKKKVRAWEQGREKKKVLLESFKLDDLRSGEVKIWRVMERAWVGWEGVN